MTLPPRLRRTSTTDSSDTRKRNRAPPRPERRADKDVSFGLVVSSETVSSVPNGAESLPNGCSLNGITRGGGGAAAPTVTVPNIVDVRLKRGGKVIKRYAAAGKGTLAFTARSLKAGRYRVEVRAYDVAGNASSLKRVSLTVR